MPPGRPLGTGHVVIICARLAGGARLGMAANYVRGWGRAEQVWGKGEERGVVGEYGRHWGRAVGRGEGHVGGKRGED